MLFEAQRARLENYQLTSDQVNLCRKRESVPVKTTYISWVRIVMLRICDDGLAGKTIHATSETTTST